MFTNATQAVEKRDAPQNHSLCSNTACLVHGRHGGAGVDVGEGRYLPQWASGPGCHPLKI